MNMESKSANRLTIIVPTYNEADNICQLLTGIEAAALQIRPTETSVVVVDDGSPDGTAGVVRKWLMERPRAAIEIEILERTEKNGLGAAYDAAFRFVFNSYSPSLILQIDADGSHRPSYIPEMVAKANAGFDLVIGSRYVAGGRTQGWSVRRRILSAAGNALARRVLSPSIHDYTGGFNLYDAALLRKLTQDGVDSTGYGIMMELKYRSIGTPARIAEVPIVFINRERGRSKMPASTIIGSLKLLGRMGTMRHKRPS